MSKLAGAPARLKSIKAEEREAAPSVSSATTSDSDDSRDDSSSGSESDSNDSDDSDDEEGEDRGFVAKISDAIQAKQQRALEKRRHPVLEWKAAARWHEENAGGLALAEENRRRKEERVAEKAATRERKVKRKVQRQLNRQKEKEFRELVQSYDEQLLKTEQRTELLTKFSIESRAREKEAIAEQQSALQAARERDAARKVSFFLNERFCCIALLDKKISLAYENTFLSRE